MANTCASIYIHYVFSTKNRAALITEKVRERLWSYMGGVARENHMTARSIGGVADHMHLLISMPTSLSIAKGIQQIKGASSVWMRDTFPEIRDFAWQEGYGAFSVSKSHIDETVAYIQRQAEHHRDKTSRKNTSPSCASTTSRSMNVICGTSFSAYPFKRPYGTHLVADEDRH